MSFISKIIHILFHKHHSGSFSSEGFAGVEGRGLAIGVIVILIPFFEEGYYAYVMFTEPAGLGDNYRQRIWRNDTLWDTQFDLNFFNDEFIITKL